MIQEFEKDNKVIKIDIRLVSRKIPWVPKLTESKKGFTLFINSGSDLKSILFKELGIKISELESVRLRMLLL